MTQKLTAVINKEAAWYVAHCIELGVVSQGKTIEEARHNLHEAVELYIESFVVDDLPQSTGEIIGGQPVNAIGHTITKYSLNR